MLGEHRVEKVRSQLSRAILASLRVPGQTCAALEDTSVQFRYERAMRNYVGTFNHQRTFSSLQGGTRKQSTNQQLNLLVLEL